MTERVRRLIGWWEIVCGGLGIVMAVAMYFDWLPGSRATLEGNYGWINYYLGIGFFSLTIAAGRSLLRHENWGLWASSLSQLVQVLSVVILHGPHIQIAAGPLLGITVSSYGLNFSAGFNVTFFLGTRLSGPGFEATLNLIPALWSVLLIKEATRPQAEPSPAAA